MIGSAGGEGVVEWVVGEQAKWSSVASRLKKGITRWRVVALVLTAVAAMLMTFASQAPGLESTLGRLVGFLAAAAIALVPIVKVMRLRTDAVGEWTRARAASEGLKSELYEYLASCPPYEGAQKASVLDDRAKQIVGSVTDLARHAVGRQVGPRAVPAVRDADSYIEHRLKPQARAYYGRRAAELQRRIELVRRVEFGLAVVGALLAAYASAWQDDAVGGWVPALTTVGAAVTAHASTSRYEWMLIEYTRTAQRLEALLRAYERGELAVTELVRQTEDAISIENKGWMAKLPDRSDP